MTVIQKLHQKVLDSKLFGELRELEAGKDDMIEVTQSWEKLRNLHCDEYSLLMSLGIKHRRGYLAIVNGVQTYRYDAHEPRDSTRITTLDDLGFRTTYGIADLLGNMEKKVIVSWNTKRYVDCCGKSWSEKRRKNDKIEGTFVKTPTSHTLAEIWIMGELEIIDRNGYEVERSTSHATDQFYQVRPDGINLKKALTASGYYDELTRNEYFKWRVNEGWAIVRSRLTTLEKEPNPLRE